MVAVVNNWCGLLCPCPYRRVCPRRQAVFRCSWTDYHRLHPDVVEVLAFLIARGSTAAYDRLIEDLDLILLSGQDERDVLAAIDRALAKAC